MSTTPLSTWPPGNRWSGTRSSKIQGPRTSPPSPHLLPLPRARVCFPPFVLPPKGLGTCPFIPHCPPVPHLHPLHVPVFAASSVESPLASTVPVAPPPQVSCPSQTAPGRLLKVNRFASASTDGAAPSPPAPVNISAPVVDLRIQRRNATSSGFLPVVTPFCWQKWEEALSAAGALEIFADVPKGICFGWRIGVSDSYSLSSSFIPPNH